MPFSRFIALIALLLLPAFLQAQPEVIPPSGAWVTDQGDFLTPPEEQALSAKLRSYADTTSTQIVVVTLSTLDGYEASEYATELGRSWGVGQQGQDNGVVILLSREEREVFIATGYGIEGAIPDAIAARIYRNLIVPAFREGQFYSGLDLAVDALVAAAKGEFTAEDVPDGEGDGGILLLVIFLVLLFVLINAAKHGGGGGGGKRYRSSRSGIPPVIIWGGGGGFGGGGGGFGGFGGGGFSGGGGSFGGGGAGGGW